MIWVRRINRLSTYIMTDTLLFIFAMLHIAYYNIIHIIMVYLTLWCTNDLILDIII